MSKSSALQQAVRYHRWPIVAVLGFWGVYFVTLFSRMIRQSTQGLFVGHENVWSDWALHIGIAHIFAYKAPSDWFAYHPMYAGGKFTYGFITDAISGLLMRAGISLPLSFILPSIMFALLLCLGLYALAYLLLKSRWQASVAVFLFFLSSGLGFMHYFADGASLATLINPPLQYSRIDAYEWYSGNVIVGLLVPQRAMLAGMTLGVWALVIVIRELMRRDDEKTNPGMLFVAGILAGILPITHAHSFIAVALVSVAICLAQLQLWRRWIWFAIPATIISVTLYNIFIAGGIETQFIRPLIGWTAKGGFVAWLAQWWWQWGLMLPFVIFVFLFWRCANSVVRAYFLTFFGLFVLANLMLFQPIRWDNSKLFTWVYFACSMLAARGLAWLWLQQIWFKVVAVMLAFCLIATGTLEVIRLQRIDLYELQESSQMEIELGEKVRRVTDPRSRFLTAPSHNHFIMVWAARPILMGYVAWVWNYGFDYQTREQHITQMYAGSSLAETLLKQYQVSYVVFSPSESDIDNRNESFYSRRFPTLVSTPYVRIYDVRSLTGQP
jgi:hypothetical protein